MGVNPQIRRNARERALQFLFGLCFTGNDCESVLEAFWKMHPAKPSVRRYADRLIRGICNEEEQLDTHIRGALENWAPERIGHIERIVLRIALYETLHCDDVPATVAINEAIEVAKRFGADDAPRFVNGMLDRLIRHLATTNADTG